MITKTPAKKGDTTKVTFELPAEYAGQRVCLCGEFNEWAPDATPMTKRKDGRFSTTINLKQGQSYRYRYLVDGERWVDDPAPDDYVDNGYGTKDSVVTV
ncbi:MAG TPA: isoamylase early set domain-containing protein [Acidimicrobiia bacterium]|nr:isoamylase early set domain-containing protein [Acidimicrobiia bacterium]